MTARAPVPDDVLRVRAPEEMRLLYEGGATIGDLELISGLSHGTVINRLRDADTRMRTPQQTRRLREGRRAQARMALALELRGLYESGATLAELADRCGRSRKTAARLLAEAGGSARTPAETRRLRLSHRDIAEQELLQAVLRSRYEAGDRVPDLAEDHGISSATVYRLLKKAQTVMCRKNRRPGSESGPAE